MLIRSLEQDCVGIIPAEISLRTCKQASIYTYKYHVSCLQFANASNMLSTCSYVAVNRADHIICQGSCTQEIKFSYCQLSRYIIKIPQNYMSVWILQCVGVLVICVPVFCIIYTVFFVLFRLCIFIFICFVCTTIRTSAI